MNQSGQVCDLCGLTVEVKGFELETAEGRKTFCCEGCRGIYQMLHESEIPGGVSDQSSKKPS